VAVIELHGLRKEYRRFRRGRTVAVAGGGEVLATAATVEACPGADVEPLGPRLVKGRKEPVDVYRVVSVPGAGSP